MADRRSVRSSSRRTTPTPQPKPAASANTTPRRNTRRGTRSASREVEAPSSARPTTRNSRRSARQPSVDSAASDQAREPNRRTKRNYQAATVADLTTVEEDDTQALADDGPRTPPQDQQVELPPHRSPGALSNISGTTAISGTTSFSAAEAEELEAEQMLDAIEDLQQSSQKFIQILAPQSVAPTVLEEIIRDLRKPGSQTNKTFRSRDSIHMAARNLFQPSPYQYIRPNSVVRALLGPNQDFNSLAKQPDLVWVLYKANLVHFAKQIVTSEQGQKAAWDALRELDTIFPAPFLSAFTAERSRSTIMPPGSSALLTESFEMALEMRTQLAIAVLERAQNENTEFDPDHEISTLFFYNEDDRLVVRGWSIAGLGTEKEELPRSFRDEITTRIRQIRATGGFETNNSQSVESEQFVDTEKLGAYYSWKSFQVKVLNWVRLRNEEIEQFINNVGGISALSSATSEQFNPTAASFGSQGSTLRGTPRRQRISTESTRRKSDTRRSRPSSDFQTTTKVTDEAIRDLFAPPDQSLSISQGPQAAIQIIEPPEDVPLAGHDLVDYGDDDEMVQQEAPTASIPTSSAQILEKVKLQEKVEKENQRRKFIDRQPNAERVQFTDTSQSPEASEGKGKAPQRLKRLSSMGASSDEDDEFQNDPRTLDPESRRRRAPVTRVAKKARFVTPPDERAPPSHQAPLREEDTDYRPAASSSNSDEEPGMTEAEEEAPSSSFAAAKQVAQMHIAARAAANPRRKRNPWTPAEEDAVVEYVGEYGLRYATILAHSKDRDQLLVERSQVDLKDKIRNMAITYIKARVGLPSGFENVITIDSKQGRALIANGYTW